MSGHYWTVSHGLRISVGSGRGAREGIWWRKRGPGDGDGDLELGSLVPTSGILSGAAFSGERKRSPGTL